MPSSQSSFVRRLVFYRVQTTPAVVHSADQFFSGVTPLHSTPHSEIVTKWHVTIGSFYGICMYLGSGYNSSLCYMYVCGHETKGHPY